MEMWLMLWIGVGAVALLFLVRRVAAGGTERGRAVLPSSLGQGTKIEELKNSFEDFNIF